MLGDFSNNNHLLDMNGVDLQTGKIIHAGSEFIGSPDHASYNLAGDFTAEFFKLNFTSVSQFLYLFSQFGTSQNSYLCRFRGDLSPKRIEFLYSTNGTSATVTSINWTPTVSTDYDVTLERSGTTLRLYVGGSSVGTTTVTGTLFNSTANFYIGASAHDINNNRLNAKYQAFRLTKGVARYNTSGSYSVPSLPLPISA